MGLKQRIMGRAMTATVIFAIAGLVVAPVSAFADEQKLSGKFRLDTTFSDVWVQNRVLQYATGNIGVNEASGLNNVQGNSTTVIGPLSNYLIINGVNQSATLDLKLDGSTQWATASDHVLRYATGNIGLNLASGAANVQQNALVAAKVEEEALGAGIASLGQQLTAEYKLKSLGEQSTAYLTNQVLRYATGNIGVNAAAGGGNMQGNVAVVIDGESRDQGVGALALGIQALDAKYGKIRVDFGDREAYLDHDVLRNAGGNIAVNIASGVANMQGNVTSVRVNGVAASALAGAATLDQSIEDPKVRVHSAKSTAYLTNRVLEYATGNIGVNVAAGAANQQLNTLTVAANSALSSDEGMTGAGSIAPLLGQKQSNIDGRAEYGEEGDFSAENPALDAGLNSRVLQYASGNIGVNVAAGTGNQQANATAISESVGTVQDVSAAASLTSQSVDGFRYRVTNTVFEAGLANRVLQYATGNIGANVAAGHGNMQQNALAIVTEGELMIVAAGNTQDVKGVDVKDSFSTYNASLTDSVLQHASGNINVNVATGVGNVQSNTLTVITAAAGIPQ